MQTVPLLGPHQIIYLQMLLAVKTFFNPPLCSKGLFAVATLRFVHLPVGEPVCVFASAR